MPADFKWILAKNFEDPLLWPKIQMTDTLSIWHQTSDLPVFVTSIITLF